MTTRRLVFFSLLLFAIGSQAFAAPERTSYLKQAGFELTPVSPALQEPLMSILHEIESRTSLRPQEIESGHSIPSVALSGDAMIVELNDSERPWETTFLFYRAETGQVLFLRATFTANEPEIRIWSQGPSEIVVSPKGAKWVPDPSATTFRLSQSPGVPIDKISAADAAVCIARILNVSSTNWSSLISIFTNLTCGDVGSIRMELEQTLLHCFSMVSAGVANVTSTLGCVTGAAKLIGCGYLACSTPSTPSGLAASDGIYSDRVHVTWNPSDNASTYVLFRSQSSGSLGSVLTSTSSTSFEDYSAIAGYKYYYYYVKACSTLGCSDVSGSDTGWRSGSSTSCNGTTYTGTLSAGNYGWQPNGGFYQSAASGTHSGKLLGPAGGDFDLYLYKYNGSSWTPVAASATASNQENISYYGTPGSYSWMVFAWSGSGTYSLCINHP
jgi:hypothetical protein